MKFINESHLEWWESLIHGVFLTFLDGIGCGSRMTIDPHCLSGFKNGCVHFLKTEITRLVPDKADQLENIINDSGTFVIEDDRVGIHPFYIQKGKINLNSLT